MSSNIQVQRVCESCGQEFLAHTTKTRYCSKKCNDVAYKQKKRESRIEHSNTIVKEVKENAFSKNDLLLKDKDILSIPEAASFLGVSRQTIYNWLKSGTIIGKRMSNRKVLILKSDLLSVFEQNQAYEAPTPTQRNPIAEFYTIQEMMEKFNIGQTWAFKIIKENNFPKTRIEGKTHISKKHVDNYFKKKQDDIANITEWYTVDEIQDKYNLTRDQIYSRVHDNNIPKQKVGRYVKISKLHFDNLFMTSL